LYVDEFQKFATTAFAELVAEARKYGVGIVLAHQNLEQLKVFSHQWGQQDQSVLSAILGNAGSMVCFGVGAPDTDVLAKQLGVTAEAVSGIGRYEALARLSVDGAWVPTMTLVTQLHEPGLDPRRQDDIRDRQRSAGRVVLRKEARRQIELRRAALNKMVADARPGPAAEDGPGDFIDGWTRKRDAIKPPAGASPGTAPNGSGPSESIGETATRARGEARRQPSEPAYPPTPAQNLVPTGSSPDEADDSRPPGVAGPVDVDRIAVGDPDDSLPATNGWDELVGPVVRLDRLAEILGESPDILRGRAESGRLLILQTRRGTEVVPASHFSGGRPLTGLDEVLEALARTDWSDWSRAGWLATPLGGLGGKSVLEWLREGRDVEMPATIAEARADDR
jgi:TraM recognition site of TraD and TraG